MRRGHPPTTTPTTGRLDWQIIRSIFPFLGAYKGRAFFAISLLIAAKAATVTVPLVLKEIVDTLDVDGADIAVAVPMGLLLAYGGLRLASGLFRGLQNTVFARVRYGIMKKISTQVVEHLHDLSLRYHLARKTGEVARDIGRGTSSVSTLLNHLLFNILPTIIEVSMVAAILLTQYSASFALVAVITVGAYGVLTFSVTRWRMKFRAAMNAKDSEASSRAIDGLLNYETVKYFSAEDYELSRYGESLQAWEDVAMRSQASLSLLNVGQAALIAIGVTWTMILAAEGVADKVMTVGDLVAVNAYLLQLFLPLGFLGTVYSMLKHALSDMERMFDLLEMEPEVQDADHALALDVSTGHVRFEDVVFGYEPDRRILDGVTIDVPAGQKVAIVGPSGAGKSTLGRLLFRFYDVQRGHVRVDGRDVRDVSQRSLREQVGIVPQDTVLFNDTLRYNLVYGRRDATDDEIMVAVRAARLEAFVADLPQGLETVVGERGLKLSGGEKQRVAIARVLLKDPPILVLDEATSSLDSESEQGILEALRALEGDRTTLVIAHRLSTITDADRIVVMGAGRVVEEGTHAELVEADGAYAQLWRMQQQ